MAQAQVYDYPRLTVIRRLPAVAVDLYVMELQDQEKPVPPVLLKAMMQDQNDMQAA